MAGSDDVSGNISQRRIGLQAENAIDFSSVKKGALWAANPEHRAKTIAVAMPGRPVLTVSVPPDGTAVRMSLRSGDRM